MIILKKDKKIYLYIALTTIIGGVVLLFYLIEYRGASGDFLTVIGKLLSIISIISGITYMVKYNKYTQRENVHFHINDNLLVYNDKKYTLDNAYLTISYDTSDKLFCTNLWIEKDNKAIEIFKNVVFNIEEMDKFLYIIKPYRKTNINLIKKEIGQIQLFNGGFTLKKREIFYNEIEKFDTQLIKTDGVDFLDIKIILKNGEKIEKRLVDGKKEYAKAIYANLIFEHNNSSKFDIGCNKKSIWWIIILFFNIFTILFIIYNNKFIEYGIFILLIVDTIYITFNNNSNIDLCQEIQKIHNNKRL